ncbi:MIP/aquaporin family protein [Sporolituus thermophilus]|uniref:Glycerol uptake facilitator protein n=1 Tax=Sporolituus thermophilus DSM 23256 TaxID=1123285 RepID=A0A1G7LA00_9FIRM|nr:MIP/aquaporin family protein [Sporolituus thermophilus]SDF45850.1 glycerol uptake facilitator protein [Sporolituus thermophilus DSM 23256]
MTNLLGEFFGTAVLIVFGSGVVANVLLKKSKAEGAGWIVITAGWAFGVIMGVFCAIAAGAPQADLNPAVTLAKTLMGVYTVPHAVATMLAELAGAFTGAVIVWLAFLPHWEITEDQGAKLGIFCTGPAIRNYSANLLCEIIGTVILIVPIFAIFSKAVGGIAQGLGPYLVGILVWGIGLSLGGPTGYAINPARDLGPRLAHAVLPIPGKGGSDWSYAWVPIVGPFIGAIIAYFIGKTFGLI